MRKNNGRKKRINPKIKDVYAYFEVKGVNLDRFIESVRRHGVTLFNIKKTESRRLILAVNLSDTEKLFAINRNVWYNTYKIRRIKIGGRNYPLYFLMKNVGIAVGVILFLTVSAVSDDFIYSFSFTGSGSEYHKEITAFLSENGIKEFSRFSSIDLKALEDSILSSNDKLSFVSCYKSGNRLIIDSALSQKNTERLSGRETELKSDVSGVIESIKVYRGTALKNVGDETLAGEILVAGYVDVKDVRVEVNVIATATIKYSEKYDVELIEDNEGVAVSVAEEIADKTPIGYTVSKSESGGKFFYTIELFFTRVITVG